MAAVAPATSQPVSAEPVRKQYKKLSLLDALNGKTLSDDESEHKTADNLQYTTRLDTLCIALIVANYTQNPGVLNEIPPLYYDELYSQLSIDGCKLADAIHHIDVQYYWYLKLLSLHTSKQYQHNQYIQGIHHNTDKAAYKHKNSVVKLSNKIDPTTNYKQQYCELYVTELLQAHNNHDTSDLAEQCALYVPYVESLQLDKFTTELRVNLCNVLRTLSNLKQLKLCYKVAKIGINYDAKQFGIRSSEVEWLSDYIARSSTLQTLTLSENQLNDELFVQLLHNGLLNNSSVASLDVAHNQLKAEFASDLCTYIAQGRLTKLSMYDNNIASAAAEELAAVLSQQYQLTELNISMNPLRDTGVAAILTALQHNTVLQRLELNSCHGATDSGSALIELLQHNATLTHLNVSNNKLFDDTVDVERLLAAVQHSSLIELNVHNTGLRDEASKQLANIVTAKLTQHKNDQRKLKHAIPK